MKGKQGLARVVKLQQGTLVKRRVFELFLHPHGLRAAYRSDGLRAWRDVLQGFRFSLRSTSQQRGAERPPEAAVAPEGPQGKSPAPGGGRGEGVSKGSPARRDAGPATKSAPTQASRKKKR